MKRLTITLVILFLVGSWSQASMAQGIKFLSAIKDGRTVSQYIQIEYNFHLY